MADDVLDLSPEIAKARFMRDRLIAEEKDLKFQVSGVVRLVGAIVQAVRTQHALAKPKEDDWLDAAHEALQEMKREGEGEHDPG